MKTYSAAAVAAAFMACLYGSPAHALPRTFVSNAGADANPCTEAAPCRTFTGALAKTDANGTINCLNTGEYSAVTINKSVTIDCTGALGTIRVASGSAISVTTFGLTIYLRGLSLDGLGSGWRGIAFAPSGTGVLHVENCSIYGFRGASPTGFGIDFIPVGASKLFVKDTSLLNNGNNTTGAGINIKPSQGATVQAQLDRVGAANNTFGLRVDGSGSTGSAGGIQVTVRDSTFTGNSQHGIQATTPAGGAPIIVTLDRVAATYNATGVSSLGPGANVRIGASVVTGNATGVQIGSGGGMRSYKTNQIFNNTVNGTPVAALPLE